MINVHFVFLILAFVCFFLAALQINAPRVNLTALGLSFWLLAEMVRA